MGQVVNLSYFILARELMLDQPWNNRGWARWVNAAIWLAVLVLAFSRFLHLGYGDLKDWDECLYMWRSKVICFRGEWLDQSDLAWGGFFPGQTELSGFYSAAFPPLQVWATAIFFRLFGISEFWARVWPALTGGLSVIALFLMGRRVGRDRWTGLFAALFLGAVWYYTVYSRRAQFDVPFTAFIVLSLYFYVGYLDRVRIVGWRRIEVEGAGWWWLVLSGIALGLGLMNKIALALMAPMVAGAVALYAWLRGRHSLRQVVAEQLVINAMALWVCLPWHLAMTLSSKGAEFWKWYIGYHLLGRSSEVLDLHSGPWYYYSYVLGTLLPAPVVALCLIAIPWSVIALLASFRKGAEKEAEAIAPGDTENAGENRERLWDYPDSRYFLPLVWLGLQLALFSVSKTKRETYTIPMYPPIALLAAVFLGERLRDRRRMKLLAVTLFAMTTLCILSRMKTFGDKLELAVRSLSQFHLWLDVWARLALLVVGVAAATAAVFWLLRRRPQAFRWLALTMIVVSATVFSLRKTRRILDPDKGTRTYGWQQIRPYIDSMDYDYLVFAGAYTHPAAYYYLNGLQADWHKTVKLVPMPTYDPEQLARFGPNDKVRVVLMKSWVEGKVHFDDEGEEVQERMWTARQLETLKRRLELLAEGNDLAIYDLKPPSAAD